MDIVPQAVPKTYMVMVTLEESEAAELKSSIDILPDSVVVVKDLLTKITAATESQ